MPNPDINFKLGELNQFKFDVCNRLSSIENKQVQMQKSLDALNVWKVKTVAQTSVITTIIWFVLSTFALPILRSKFGF